MLLDLLEQTELIDLSPFICEFVLSRTGGKVCGKSVTWNGFYAGLH